MSADGVMGTAARVFDPRTLWNGFGASSSGYRLNCGSGWGLKASEWPIGPVTWRREPAHGHESPSSREGTEQVVS